MDDSAVTKFFLNKPIQHHLFGLINQYLHSLGSIKVKVTKSQISFTNKRQFAWIWLPMAWDKKRPKDSVVNTSQFNALLTVGLNTIFEPDLQLC